MIAALRLLIIACAAGALLWQNAAHAQGLPEIKQGSPPAEALYSAPAQNLEQAPARPGLPTLTPVRPGAVAHLFPSRPLAARLGAAAADSGPLLYHTGGSVMVGPVQLYVIFWAPATLQNGSATGFSSTYVNTMANLVKYYGGKGLGANNTQYFQTISGQTSYVDNIVLLAGGYLDTAAYPASGCTDTRTPGACITDAQIQTEIQRVVSLNGWTVNSNSMFILFTSQGEGSCFDSSNTSCAYTSYCAYHSFFSGSSSSILYANIPYGDATDCQVPSAPSPNGDAAADAAATALSHEITETITDPLLNAWYTAQGNEIGDLCAYIYGTNTWDSAKANQMWNGFFFELQEEFDNHTNSCVQHGP